MQRFGGLGKPGEEFAEGEGFARRETESVGTLASTVPRRSCSGYQSTISGAGPPIWSVRLLTPMNILRSKYLNNPVVAAMIIVGAAFVMMLLNERSNSGFPDAEMRVIRTFCDIVGFPLGLIEWAGWNIHPKSHALRVVNMVVAIVVSVVTWTIIIYGIRGLIRRINRNDTGEQGAARNSRPAGQSNDS